MPERFIRRGSLVKVKGYSKRQEKGRSSKESTGHHAALQGRCHAVIFTCKHAPKAPEVEGIVIVLEVHKQLRTLEVSRGNTNVVPEAGEGQNVREAQKKQRIRVI